MESTTITLLAAALAAASILSAVCMWRSVDRLERSLLGLIPGDEARRQHAISASRRARLARGAVLVTAAASVALATLAALGSAERTDVLADEIETRPAPSGPPLPTAAEADALRARVRQARLPPGFLFGVYSVCGEAQNSAADLVAALRGGGAIVFASPRCGPMAEGFGRGLSLIVNQNGREIADARRAAEIFVRAGLARTAPKEAHVGSITADLIVLVGR